MVTITQQIVESIPKTEVLIPDIVITGIILVLSLFGIIWIVAKKGYKRPATFLTTLLFMMGMYFIAMLTRLEVPTTRIITTYDNGTTIVTYQYETTPLLNIYTTVIPMAIGMYIAIFATYYIMWKLQKSIQVI